MHVDLNTVVVGEEVAINRSHAYPSYIFCKVTRVTKAQVEVTAEDKTYKFSKATGRILGGNSWDDKKYLEPRKDAEAAYARHHEAQALRREKQDIRSGLIDIANGFWDDSKVDDLQALVERMKAFIAS